MFIKDTGLVICTRSVSEKSSLVKVFMQHHGLLCGMSRKSKLKSAYSGAFVYGELQKKANNQLGYFSLESRNICNFSTLMTKMENSIIINSAIAFLNVSLIEGEKNTTIWNAVMHLLTSLAENNNITHKLKAYLAFEVAVHHFNGAINNQWFTKKDGVPSPKLLFSNQDKIDLMGLDTFILRLALHESAKLMLQSNLRTNRISAARKLIPKLLNAT